MTMRTTVSTGITSAESQTLSDSQVLVLAPRFPSINQPWMDTYLEQLAEASIPFVVLSRLTAPTRYQTKVDALGLRSRCIAFGDSRGDALAATVRGLLRQPFRTVGAAFVAWRVARCESSFERRVGAALRGLGISVRLAHLGAMRVVHSHALQMGYEVIPLADKRRLPLVLTFHGLAPAGVPQVPLHRRQAVFRRASVVLVNTEFARAQAIELGCPPGKLVVLPQGLPLDDFRFVARAAPALGEPLTLLSVGRFHRDKGQRYSLLALNRLRRLGVDAHWHFVGVGPDLNRLKAFADRLKIGAFVTFHNEASIDELKALYRSCHLLVLASLGASGGTEHVETQGVVLQEAQASGCIPIATRTGGIPECITDGYDGVLVEERSHRAIANAILELVQHPERWAPMQQRGRRTVEERFAAPVVGRRMAQILKEVAGPLD
jgi:glycosyltransferase involved in cell wall biosynthesis